MFYKTFINHRKKLFHLVKLKSISEKHGAMVIKNLAHIIYLSFFHHKNIIWSVFIETSVSTNMVKSEDYC